MVTLKMVTCFYHFIAQWSVNLPNVLDPIDFQCVDKNILNIFKIPLFVFYRREKAIHVLERVEGE